MADDLAGDGAIAETRALLSYYGFELTEMDLTPQAILQHWQKQYPPHWLRAAVLEALYRGRYKQVSVEEILRRWQNRGEPYLNFDREFERLICAKLETDSLIPQTPEPIVVETSEEIDPQPLKAAERFLEIERFRPQLDGQETYEKLRAIAQDLPKNENPSL